MKHLRKIFEEKEDFYTPFNGDYINSHWGDPQPISNSEIKEIESTLGCSVKYINDLGSSYIAFSKDIDGITLYGLHIPNKLHFNYSIEKFNDEWWYVHVEECNKFVNLDTGWQCDQFEGLLQLLKDINDHNEIFKKI